MMPHTVDMPETVKHAVDEMHSLFKNLSDAAEGKEQFKGLVQTVIDSYHRELGSLRDTITRMETDLRRTKSTTLDIQESLDDHRFMQQLSKTIRLSKDAREIVEQLAQLSQRVVISEESAIFLLNEDETNLSPLFPETRKTHFGQAMESFVGEGVIDLVLNEQRVMVIPDIELMSNTASESGDRNYVIVPLLFLGRAIGVYVIYTPKSQDTFSPQDLEILLMIAEQAAVAIDNIRLQKALKAMKMELTKIKSTLN